jgi:hypothetical protein
VKTKELKNNSKICLKRAQIPENFVIAYENKNLTRVKLKEEQF